MNETNSFFLALNNEQGTIPKRIQLLPTVDKDGKIIGVDGRSWILRNASTLCAQLNTTHNTTHSYPIDENHSTDLAAPKGLSAPAFGWFSNFTVESDGSIWADAEWNARGQQAVANREYRYISPVFVSDEKKEITHILRAALTNNPNLNNPALNASSQSQSQPEKPAQGVYMEKELAVALGLTETATVTEAIATIIALKTSLNASQKTGVDLSAYAPRADLNAMEARTLVAERRIAELNAANLSARGTVAVDKALADRKIAPASREEYLNLCSSESGLAIFSKIMATTPALITEQGVLIGSPPSVGTVALNTAEKSLASSMGYTDDEYAKMKKAGV